MEIGIISSLGLLWISCCDHLHKSLCIDIWFCFSEVYRRGGMAGWYSKFMLNFVRNWQMLSKAAVSIYIPTSNVGAFSISLVTVVIVFINSCFNELVMVFYCHFILHFPSDPLQYSCLENPMDRGAWHAIVHRVAKSRTQLSDQHFHTFSDKYCWASLLISCSCVLPDELSFQIICQFFNWVVCFLIELWGYMYTHKYIRI